MQSGLHRPGYHLYGTCLTGCWCDKQGKIFRFHTALLGHAAFSIRNPNRVRALIGAFCTANQLRFHAADGSGYRFLADQVLTLDPINPQVAARLLGPLGPWRRFDAARGALMRTQLERILNNGRALSADVYEIASKSLGT